MIKPVSILWVLPAFSRDWIMYRMIKIGMAVTENQYIQRIIVLSCGLLTYLLYFTSHIFVYILILKIDRYNFITNFIFSLINLFLEKNVAFKILVWMQEECQKINMAGTCVMIQICERFRTICTICIKT